MSEISHHISGSQTSERLDYIDGIRGVGAVVVFYYHLIVMFTGEQFTRLEPIYKSILLDGPLAVLVFFVISGIALSAASIAKPGHSVFPSFVARYFRLAIPILLTSLIAFILLNFGLMFNHEVADTGRSTKWLGSFYQMWPSLEGVVRFSLYDVFFAYRSETSYNSSLWTISFEFAGSIALYLMLICVDAPKRRRLAAIILFLLLFPKNTYVSCFFAGYLLAEFAFASSKWTSKRFNFAGMALLLIGAAATSLYRPNSVHYWTIIAIIIVLACIMSSTIRSALSGPIGKMLGRISFPLYLGHIFVICSLSSYLYLVLPGMGFSPKESFTINIVASSVAAFGLAALLIPIENLSVSVSRMIGKKASEGAAHIMHKTGLNKLI
jgi:peptidoglycan/LPS O-acetylase OafA/YrhL